MASTEFLKELRSKLDYPLGDGKTLIEKTFYDDLALWWFVQVDLTFSLVIRAENYSRSGSQISLKQNLFYCFEPFYDLFAFFICKLFNVFRKKGGVKEIKILFTAQDRQWGKAINDRSKKEKTDIFFDPIFSKLLKERRHIITTYPLGYSFQSFKCAFEKILIQKDISHFPFNEYWSWGIYGIERQAKKHFNDVWNGLKGDSRFKELWTFNNKCVYDEVKEDLKRCFIDLFPRAVKYIEMAKKMLLEEKPDAVIILNEYGFFEQSLLIASKRLGIPVVAIQHGNITSTHVGYIYDKKDIAKDGSASFPYYPIPDSTAVYGGYYYDLLTRLSAYPTNKVVITGQPRYDIFHNADKLFDRELFFRHQGLSQEKKMIVVCTECLPINEQNERYLGNILAALKKMDDIQIIVKPHPNESFPWYMDVAKAQGIDCFFMPKQASILEALYACDLMVAYQSTTITEAIILNKPVVIVDLFDSDYPASYEKYGVAIRVTKSKDIEPAIRSALYDKGVEQNMALSRGLFIKDHCYVMDGKASERVVKLIKDYIKL